MVMSATVETPQFRLANYYLAKLRTAAAAFKCGHEHSTDALALFDQEWSQIKRWRDWSAEHSDDHDEIADLCMEYPQVGSELFLLRLHPHERLEWLKAGLAAARRLGDPEAEMVNLLHLGRTHSYLGSLDIAMNIAELALELAQQVGNSLYISRIQITLGGIFYGQDEYEKSRIANEQALAIATELGANHEIGAALNGLGNVAFSQSDHERAYDCYVRFMEISEAIGLSTGICMALRNLSMVTKRMGDADAATSYAERCVALCREVGYQACLAESLAELGTLSSDRGQLTEAQNYYQQSLDLSRQLSHRSNEAFVLYRLGCLVFQKGDLPASLDYLEASASLSKQIGERWFAALALMNLAELFRVKGDIQRACLKLCEGWEIAAAIESRAIRAKYLIEAAQLWHDQGRVRQAALWTGLLDTHVEKLMAEERRRYENLRQTLAAELSPEQFAVAIECGKTLDLDSEIGGAMRDLDHAMNARLTTADNQYHFPSL